MLGSERTEKTCDRRETWAPKKLKENTYCLERRTKEPGRGPTSCETHDSGKERVDKGIWTQGAKVSQEHGGFSLHGAGVESRCMDWKGIRRCHCLLPRPNSHQERESERMRPEIEKSVIEVQALCGLNRAMQPRCAKQFEAQTPNRRRCKRNHPAKTLRYWPAMQIASDVGRAMRTRKCRLHWAKKVTLSHVFWGCVSKRSLPTEDHLHPLLTMFGNFKSSAPLPGVGQAG